MVLMIPGRSQSFAGEVSGSPGQVVEGSLQVVELLPLASCLLPVGALPKLLVGFQGSDQLGVDAPAHVFRCDSPPSPDGSVEIGSAVAIDERHVYYAPRSAPLRLVRKCTQ
jgi:hypothetical protein